MVEPIRGGVEAGMRLGVGKQEQENFYMAAENVTRKRMETEVQGDEDQDRTQRREVRSTGHSYTQRNTSCRLLFDIIRIHLEFLKPVHTPHALLSGEQISDCTKLAGLC